MYVRKIQIRAAVLAVTALAVIAAASTSASAATTSSICAQNPDAATGIACIEQQTSSQTVQNTPVKRNRRHAVKKHNPSQCPNPNPYFTFIYCR
jgi:hypothetical protein